MMLLALALSLPLIYLTDLPLRDVLSRYAPMAQAFGEGRWQEVLHPRIPPLQQTAGGLLAWSTGCNGFLAVKLASTLFFVATLLPLYGIWRQIFPHRIVLFGLLLFVFCSQLLRLASSGLRESGKGFAFALAVYGLLVIYRERRRFAGYLLLGLAAGLLMLIKEDCVLYAAVFWLAALILLLADSGRRRSWPKAVAGLFLSLLLVLPYLVYNYRTVGYPVPGGRFAALVMHFQKPAPSLVTGENLPSVPPPAVIPSQFAATGLEESLDFADGLLNGFFPLYAVIALPVIVFRIRRRRWQPEETLLLAAVLGHALLLCLQILLFDRYLYVSRRYLLPVSGLFFIWTAVGLLTFAGWLRRRLTPRTARRTIAVGYTILLVGLYADALLPQWKQRVDPKHCLHRQAVLTLAAWIRDDYRGPQRNDCGSFDLRCYRSNRRPLVTGPALPELGYLAGGEAVETFSPNADYQIDEEPADRPPAEIPGFAVVKILPGHNGRYVLRRKAPGNGTVNDYE